jgi:uncharacterized RmlC-like cupin family protein
VTIQYGPTGREQATAAAGNFIFCPARMVHREITAPDEPAEFFVVRVGTGPQKSSRRLRRLARLRRPR